MLRKILVCAMFLALSGCWPGFNNPLNEAAANNDVERIAALMAEGADVNARGGHGITPLCSAARAGALDAIAALVAKGADPNLGSGVNGWTPIMHAIHKHQPGSVTALIKAGADVNARGEGGHSALKLASDSGAPDIVKILLAHGAV